MWRSSRRSRKGCFPWIRSARAVTRWRERSAIARIRTSRAFDIDGYVQRYPDVAESDLDPITHYVRHGVREGRDPMELFSGQYYLEQNPDVARARVNPLLHYLEKGADEGRNPHPVFDTDFYIRTNPFVRESELNPLAHYLHVGRIFGRPTGEIGNRENLAQETVRGAVDRVSRTLVLGWARWDPGPETPVLLDVYVDGKYHSSTRADRLRRDLVRSSEDSGYFGFAWEPTPLLSEERDRAVEIRPRRGENRIEGATFRLPRLVRGVPIGGARRLPVWRRTVPNALVQGDAGRSPSVELVVLNRNGAALLERFFAALVRENTHSDLRVAVVDHGSRDDSAAVVKRWCERLRLRWIARKSNYSFSESNNVVALASDADVVVFANNDVYFVGDVLPALARLAQEPDVGAVGVTLRDAPLEDGEETSRAPLQHVAVHFDRFRSRGQASDEPWFLEPFECREVPGSERLEGHLVEVPAVTGACMAVRSEVFRELGGFHEGYFYGYEDVDLCLRLRESGRRVLSANFLEALHDRAHSRRRMDPSSARRLVENRRLLDERFGVELRRQMRFDLFERPGFWSATPLRIGFAVTETGEEARAGDVFTALELGRELEAQFFCRCYLLDRTSWYELGGIDVVVAMVDQYEPSRIRHAAPHLIRIAWVRNWFERFASSESAADFDLIWASSLRAARFLEERLAKPVGVMHIATAFERFEKAKAREVFRCDYCFTGHHWGAHREIVRCLDPAKLSYRGRVYGDGWEEVEELRPIVQGPVPYRDMPEVYASTRVVVDDANHVTKPWGSVNSRVFDALAAGALVVTNGDVGSRDVFDGLLPSYRNAAELNDLLTRYLEDEPARDRLVASLREVVRREHTYRRRAQQAWRALRQAAENQIRFSIKVGAPSAAVREEWGDWHFARGLKRALERHGHRVRVDCLDSWSNSEAVGDDVVLVLRGLSAYEPRAGQVNLLWMISHPDKVSLEECNGFDHVFVASSSYAQQLGGQLVCPVSVLLQCTDPERFHPEAEPAPDGPEVPPGEIVFAGNSRNVFRPIVRDAERAGLRFSVFGTRWEQFLDKQRIAAEHVPNATLPALYASAAVVLNDHWDSMRRFGFLSNRLFDAAATGAPIVSDPVEGLDSVFGECVRTYVGPKELRAVIEALRQETPEEKARRARMAEQIRAEHSFDRRADEILAVVRRHLRSRNRDDKAFATPEARA